MFQKISIACLLGMAVALALYHLILRRRRVSKESERRVVYRFSLLERCLHAISILSLVTLAATGFAAACLGESLRGGLWLVHYATAPIFAGAVCLMALIWAQDGRFEVHDWRWFLHLGGYLWKKEDLPAGRFNAGQKSFFWFVGFLSILVILSGVGRMFPLFDATGQRIIYQVHRYSALLLTMAVIAHFYLGIFANPGTLWGMISGYVSPNWAKHHHPVWWEGIEGREGKTN